LVINIGAGVRKEVHSGPTVKARINIGPMGLERDEKHLLNYTTVARELVTKSLKVHTDFLIRDLKALACE
jgi:hypothetical protein